MFHESRDFRAIAMRSNKIFGLNDLWSLFDPKNIEIRPIDSQLPVATEDRLEITHAYFFSPKKYVSADDAEIDSDKSYFGFKVKRRGKIQYRYSIYAIGLRLTNAFVCLLAAPFGQIICDLFEPANPRISGLGLQYQKIDLNKLVEAVFDNRNLGGFIKLTKIEMQVQGEPDTKSVQIGGPDVAHSRAYKSVVHSLRGGSLLLQQRRCRLVYNDYDGRRMTLEADRFGNFRFRMSIGARNLPHVSQIFNYLDRESLLDETRALPILRDATGGE